MVMEMVLVLTVVLMETPDGGWRSLPEAIDACKAHVRQETSSVRFDVYSSKSSLG